MPRFSVRFAALPLVLGLVAAGLAACGASDSSDTGGSCPVGGTATPCASSGSSSAAGAAAGSSTAAPVGSSAACNPPAGLVVHTHYLDHGSVHVVDVWDSEEAFDRFQETTLMPAMQKVAAAHGMDMSQGPAPDTTISTVAGLVTGR